jgi:hypothetical protein
MSALAGLARLLEAAGRLVGWIGRPFLLRAPRSTYVITGGLFCGLFSGIFLRSQGGGNLALFACTAIGGILAGLLCRINVLVVSGDHRKPEKKATDCQ